VTTPSNALDPLVMLATGMHAQPGVYALLPGSGVSTGAGIPTGWEVIKAIVRRAAAATAPDHPAAGDEAAEDPEAWWVANHGGQSLGYSNLLAAVASRPAARRGLLAGFFEPSEEELDAGLKVPGPAHHAVAALVKRGLVKVIITTNFDRLTERALEEAGVPPQVVSRPEAVAGITPLSHAKATVVKLNGDYADLQARNTVEELSDYPPAWKALLHRVFDEYGLVISGWSADWDLALVRALEEVPSRRYPLYWDSRSSRGEAARRLLAQHQGHVVQAASADELFGSLLAGLDALDRLAEPPIASAMAIARLKRFLPDPVRRIDLHDLVMGRVEDVAGRAARQPVYLPSFDVQVMGQVLAERLADVTPLLFLLSTGVAHDRRREHTNLWISAIHRLMQTRPITTGTLQPPLDRARQYPALLALRAAGIVALHSGHDDVLLRLLTEPTYRDRYATGDVRVPAVHALHDLKVLDRELVNTLPRWKGTGWLYPMSHLVRVDLREVLRPWLPDDDENRRAFDAYEYRAGLVVHTSQGVPGAFKAAPGEYIGDRSWTGSQPTAELDFVAALQQADDDWPWWNIVGGRTGWESTLESLREVLARHQRW
jgi:hypothetical protein